MSGFMFKMMAFGDEATPSMKVLWALQVGGKGGHTHRTE